ncbi:MAG: hypothetical protein RL497_1475, partial [Pseudomonadota bacterium]
MQAPTFSPNKAQLLALAIASITQGFCALVWAAPEGGQVVAGQGAIEQIEKETRIQQATERLSIDWKNFDVNSDERVKFIQPNSSSIAFNRILSNKGSLIQGQIDANGQVVLINPNGIIFTQGASVNAGALIASALQMSDQDYLNGKFTLNALEGTEGRVINSGLLNAATGGNISLIGQSVENNGLISANLGSVNLAAGKEAVLTFEPNGLIGVKITQEVLQKDLGVDAAIINNGEIKTEGGKVLLTASVSKDIFSQAVNTGELKQAKSAVVHEDGSFTLGGGADVQNTGAINVGGEGKAGEAVIIGENITNQGTVSADSQTENAGKIEITAKNINETKDKGTVTAVAHKNGKGGDIKLLGDKVGLLDSAKIDASGANGGGQVLLGGDKTGDNPLVKNAQFLYVSEEAQVHVDGIKSGAGGKLIAFSEDTTRIGGVLSAAGGHLYGDGGFIETSGWQGLDIIRAPNVSAESGNAGKWLIDPNNITIEDSNFLIGFPSAGYESSSDTARIGWQRIQSVLNSGGTVEIITGQSNNQNGGTISISAGRTLALTQEGTLTLRAKNNIEVTQSASGATVSATGAKLNLNLFADNAIDLRAAKIDTNGGTFIATANTGTISSTNEITTSGAYNTNALAADYIARNSAGAITLTATAGAISVNKLTASGGAVTDHAGSNGAAITLTGNSITSSGLITSQGGEGHNQDRDGALKNGGHAGAIVLTANTGAISVQEVNANGGGARPVTPPQGSTSEVHNLSAHGGNAASITLSTANQAIILGGNVNAAGAPAAKVPTDTTNSVTDGQNGNITFTGNVQLNAAAIALNTTTQSISQTTPSPQNGAITINGSVALAAGVSSGNLSIDADSILITDAIGTQAKPINELTLRGLKNITAQNIHTRKPFLRAPLITLNSLFNYGTTGSEANPDIRLMGAAGVLNYQGGGLNNSIIVNTENNSQKATLNGPLTGAAWGLNGVDSGTFSAPGTIAPGVHFYNIKAINAGSGDDTFSLSAAGWAGTLDAGAGLNELRLPSDTNAVNWALSKNQNTYTAQASGALTTKINVTGSLAQLTASGTGSNGLNLNTSTTTTWSLTSTTPVFSLNNSDLGALSFTGFNALNGGTGADVFDYSANAALHFVGSLNGGDGATIKDEIKGLNTNTLWDLSGTQQQFITAAETINFSAIETLTGGSAADTVKLSSSIKSVDLGGPLGDVTLNNIETLQATSVDANNKANAKLTGYAASSTWDITGVNTGKITDTTNANNATEFTGFSELISASGTGNADTFTLGATNTTQGVMTKITGQKNDILNARSGAGIVNNWLINADGTAQVKDANNAAYITTLDGVGTVNGSVDADSFIANGIYKETINARPGNEVGDTNNSLTTNKADVVFAATEYTTNGIKGINGFNASGSNTEFKATAAAATNTLEWSVTPGGAANLTGSVKDVASNQTLNFTNFDALTGGSNNDSFTLGAGTFTGGTIKAGTPASASTQDRLINTTATTTWDLTTNQVRGISFSGFNYLQGSNTDTLNAANIANTWSFSSVNATLNTTLNTATNLSGFSVINGGNQKDIFNINTNTTGINLFGNAGADEFILADASIKTDLLDGGTNTSLESDSVKVNSGTNNWITTAAHTGSVNANNFSGIEVLAGGLGGDTLTNQIITSQSFLLTAAGAGALQSQTTGQSQTTPPIVAVNVTGMETIKAVAELKGLDTGALSWNITGTDKGTLTTQNNNATQTLINFDTIAQLSGGDANDIFDLTASDAKLTNEMNGGNGVNTVKAPNAINTWKMTNATATDGTVTGGFTFKNIQTLNGGNLSDTLDVSAVANTTANTTVKAGNLLSIEHINGDGTTTLLQGANTANTWQLTTATAGALNNVLSNTALSFSGVAGVLGGSGQDIFNLTNATQFTGTINGGVNTATGNTAAPRDEIKLAVAAGTFAVTQQG